MIKYIVVAESPLQLINGLEYCFAAEKNFLSVHIIYFEKKKNEVKNKQSRNILKSICTGGVTYVRSPLKRTSTNWLLSPLKVLKEAIGWNRTLSKISSLGIQSRDKITLIGFGSWLVAVSNFYTESTTVIVDGGVSTVRKDKLNVGGHPVTFFFPYPFWWASCLLCRNFFNLKPLSAFDIYFSSYVQVKDKVPGRFVKNEKRWQKEIAHHTIRSSNCYFVSCNANGKLTYDDFYHRAIDDFKNRCDGSVFYYPRGNEQIAHAKYICQQHGLTIVEPLWPFELYLSFVNNEKPSLVASLHSTAIDVIGDTYGEDLPTITYADSNAKSGGLSSHSLTRKKVIFV